MSYRQMRVAACRFFLKEACKAADAARQKFFNDERAALIKRNEEAHAAYAAYQALPWRQRWFRASWPIKPQKLTEEAILWHIHRTFGYDALRQRVGACITLLALCERFRDENDVILLSADDLRRISDPIDFAISASLDFSLTVNGFKTMREREGDDAGQ